jgi:hypothetical protein
MLRYLSLVVCVVLGSAGLGAANKEQDRLENCGVVMQEILDIPENIPQELLEKAECVIIIPSMTKVALGIGGSYGRGAMVCRSGKAFNGPWGAPAMYTLEGGSFGLQLGGESTDVVFLVMNSRGVDALLNSKVKLGGSLSVDRRVAALGNPQLLAVARPLRRDVARRDVAASRRRREQGSLRTQHDGANDRDGQSHPRSGIRPPSGRCAAEECAAQRVEAIDTVNSLSRGGRRSAASR